MPLEADRQVGACAAAELKAQLPGTLHQGNLQQGFIQTGMFRYMKYSDATLWSGFGTHPGWNARHMVPASRF